MYDTRFRLFVVSRREIAFADFWFSTSASGSEPDAGYKRRQNKGQQSRGLQSKGRNFLADTSKGRQFERPTFKRSTFKMPTFKRPTFKRPTFKRLTNFSRHIKRQTIEKADIF